MKHLIVFNGRSGCFKQEIQSKDWMDFMKQLTDLVTRVNEPPDLIYLMDAR